MQRHLLWSAEAQLPPDAEASLQHSKGFSAGHPSPAALKGVGFSRAVGMAGGTPAFPASRVLGARASRSHGGKNALFGNATSGHARKKKNYPFRGEGLGVRAKKRTTPLSRHAGEGLRVRV